MKPIKIKYHGLMPCDVYFTHSNKPFGRIIRFACTGKIDPCDDVTPTHCGIVTSDCGQLFATEMHPYLTVRSLEKYTGKSEQIVQVWRPVWMDVDTRVAVQSHLALLRRRNLEKTQYDLWGAILSSPLGAKLFGRLPFVKNSEERVFCSELVAETLRHFGDTGAPDSPSPLDLAEYFAENSAKYRYIPRAEWSYG